MKKTKLNPSGLQSLVDDLYSNGEEAVEVTNIDDQQTFNTVEDDNDDNDPANTNNAEEDDDLTVGNDDSKIPDDINKTLNNDNKNPNDNDDDTDTHDVDLSNEEITEAQQVSALFDAVGESLGWNMADIDEEDRPLTVDDFTKYLGKVVEQNSVPQYADERIQKLDEYVKNGGNFEEFYSMQQQSMSLDNLDLEDESVQKDVIKNLLKRSGYTDDQISNKISRYEDAGMLYEESEDALERLRIIHADEVEINEKHQRELAEQLRLLQEQFFTDVTNNINNLDNIRGISVPKEDRKALYDYIFKVDKDGVSLYQKDFNSNLSKNLIESAYFTMKGDSLVSGAKRTGETSAAEKLRKLMRHLTKNHTRYNAQDKLKSATDLINGMF